MTRWLSRDRLAIAASLSAPPTTAAILLPFRASWSNTNVALPLVVWSLRMASIGSRAASGIAAVWAAVWFDFFFTVPFYRFTIRSSSDITTASLLHLCGLSRRGGCRGLRQHRRRCPDRDPQARAPGLRHQAPESGH